MWCTAMLCPCYRLANAYDSDVAATSGLVGKGDECNYRLMGLKARPHSELAIVGTHRSFPDKSDFE